MRILQIHNRYRQSGGEDLVAASEAQLLTEAGHDVAQFIVENSADTVAAGLQLLAAPWNLRSASRVRTQLRALKPDVVHVHNTWFALSPAIFPAIRAEGFPTVLTLHNYRLTCANAMLFRDGSPCELCVDGSPWNGLRYRCYRNSAVESAIAVATIRMGHEFSWLKSIDRLVCLTEFQRSLMTRAGFPEDLLTVKPNFVYYPGPRRLKPSESNQVLFVGRLSEEKGVKLLVEAWNTADPEWGNLVIIGDGPLRTELEAISGDSVTFHGWRPRAEIIDLMLESRALFLPSLWYEGLPLVLLEALSAGLPVVASSLGVSGSLISGISNTLVVETDRDEWVRAVDNLGSRSDLDSIGRSMSQSYQSTFNPTKQLEMLEELYGSVIAEFRG